MRLRDAPFLIALRVPAPAASSSELLSFRGTGTSFGSCFQFGASSGADPVLHEQAIDGAGAAAASGSAGGGSSGHGSSTLGGSD
eukprot:3410699-Pleurochrysis_carterae.AAC.1